jgi:enoyl-CoA hydratase
MIGDTAGHENLLVTDDDGIRVITIDRPTAKNALDSAMRNTLIDLVADADIEDDVHAIVITATDPVFSAGVDFKESMQPAPSADGAPAVRRRVDWALRADPAAALRACITPTICAVNGACVSGGLEIALSCSFVIASERARFADTHARLNDVAGWGLSALLPRAVGLRKAREMSITGNFVDAEEALRIGLVNHVVRHDELLTRAVGLARDISPQPAVREVLRLYARNDGLSLSEALAMERDWTVHRVSDPEAFRRLGQEAAKRGSAE